MITVLLVIHLLVTIALVGIVLVQRSEGGALGIGGGGGGGGGVMTGRAAGNVLTRSTWILASAFFAISVTMAMLTTSGTDRRSILDDPVLAIPPVEAPGQPATPVPPAR